MVQSLFPDRHRPFYARHFGVLQLYSLRYQRSKVHVAQIPDPGVPLRRLGVISSRFGLCKFGIHALEFLSGSCGEGLGWREQAEETGAAVLCYHDMSGIVWTGYRGFPLYGIGGYSL